MTYQNFKINKAGTKVKFLLDPTLFFKMVESLQIQESKEVLEIYLQLTPKILVQANTICQMLILLN